MASVLRKFILLLFGLAAVATGFWALLTQPILAEPGGPPVVLADAGLLEKHVRMLSETLPERSDDVDGLNASAEYIFQVFSHYGSPQYQDF